MNFPSWIHSMNPIIMKLPGASGRGGGSRARPAGGKEGGACCGGCEQEALLVDDEFVI